MQDLSSPLDKNFFTGDIARMALVYKLCTRQEWVTARAQGRYEGSAVDRRDGFIHLSAGSQVRETARRHFAGVTDLLLVAVDEQPLGSALVWEPSRSGARFPHLYGPLPLDAVLWAKPLPFHGAGHAFPSDIPE